MKSKATNFAGILMLCTLLISTSACSQIKRMNASKNYITKEIKVTDFDGIKLLGSADIVYTQSKDSTTRVQIYGSDNVVDLLEVQVINRTLVVKMKNHINIFGDTGELKVIASSPSINRAILEGSGDIILENDIHTADLTIQLQGSGDIKSKGLFCKTLSTTLQGSGDIGLGNTTQAQEATFLMQGSGDIKAKNISASKASFTLQGSGDIKAEGTNNINDLTVKLDGSGDMGVRNIKGTKVNAQLQGSGDIELSGNTQFAILDVNNSGTINASNLCSQVVNASVNGSGNITCYPVNEVTANVNGSGDVQYKGTPGKVNLSKGKPGKLHQL